MKILLIFTTILILGASSSFQQSSQATSENRRQESRVSATPSNRTQLTNYLVGIIIGITTSFVGFLLKDLYQSRKSQKSETKKYIICLESTKQELSFYVPKLKQMAEEMVKLISAMEKGGISVLPSYTFYPEFLGKCKIELNHFFKNNDLVKEVGYCHFELCHIVNRLKHHRNDILNSTDKRGSSKYTISDLKGFTGLISSNIDKFNQTILEIDKELTHWGSKI